MYFLKFGRKNLVMSIYSLLTSFLVCGLKFYFAYISILKFETWLSPWKIKEERENCWLDIFWQQNMLILLSIDFIWWGEFYLGIFKYFARKRWSRVGILFINQRLIWDYIIFFFSRCFFVFLGENNFKINFLVQEVFLMNSNRL